MTTKVKIDQSNRDRLLDYQHEMEHRATELQNQIDMILDHVVQKSYANYVIQYNQEVIRDSKVNEGNKTWFFWATPSRPRNRDNPYCLSSNDFLSQTDFRYEVEVLCNGYNLYNQCYQNIVRESLVQSKSEYPFDMHVRQRRVIQEELLQTAHKIKDAVAAFDRAGNAELDISWTLMQTPLWELPEFVK